MKNDTTFVHMHSGDHLCSLQKSEATFCRSALLLSSQYIPLFETVRILRKIRTVKWRDRGSKQQNKRSNFRLHRPSSHRKNESNHLGDQKCRKRAPRSVEFNFFINCDRHKRSSQNEKRSADLKKQCLRGHHTPYVVSWHS